MSESQGTNATTGTTNTEATDTEAAAKAAKRAEADAQKLASKLDKQLDTRLVAVDKSLDKLAEVLTEAKENDVWKHLTDGEGNPFKSWATYIAAKLATAPRLHAIGRREMVAELVKAGMSVRAIAQAAQVSVGTAQGDVQAVKGRTAQPGGDSAGTAPTAAQTAAKAVTQAQNACKRVKDTAADMSDSELEKLRIELKETHNIVAGLLKLRGEVANAAKVAVQEPSTNGVPFADAIAGKPAKATPNTVAAKVAS